MVITYVSFLILLNILKNMIFLLLLFLLDIEKAFDSVKHDFLLEILKRFNFGDKFIDWIKVIYSGEKKLCN